MHARPNALKLLSAVQQGESELPEDCSRRAMQQQVHAAERWKKMVQLARQRGARLVTLLRDPVEHLLSFFSHGWSWPTDWLPELVRFVNGTEFSANMQLGFLAGKRLDILQSGQEAASGREPIERATCRLRNPAAVTEEDLHYVEELIDSGVLLAGTTENMRASVEIISEELHWSNFNVTTYGDFGPRSKEHYKATTRNGDASLRRVRKNEVPKEILGIIRSRSHLDMQLYHRIRRQLSDRTAKAEL